LTLASPQADHGQGRSSGAAIWGRRQSSIGIVKSLWLNILAANDVHPLFSSIGMSYDAILVVSFGGPESREDVIPFLENVLRGRNVPRERMLAVAEHYYHFEGHSPINQQTRELISALKQELGQHGPKLPVYWGNRNWHPLLPDTLRQMRGDGIRRALAFVTSAYSSYSGCRQYREDIARAQSEVGNAPQIEKIRPFFNHPGFIDATEERLRGALQEVPTDAENVRVIYVAHSIPLSMATSCDYVRQLEEVRTLLSQRLHISYDALVYQSRSGVPGQPWLEPDILDYLRDVKANNLAGAVVLAPISFISDHLEVLYDLDIEARQLCDSLSLPMVRAKTVGVHPKFIAMIRDLILERTSGARPQALGSLGARADVCAEDCCPAPARPSGPHCARAPSVET
jgi:protoporphyrin/coproporphyrin ferrochelatase